MVNKNRKWVARRSLNIIVVILMVGLLYPGITYANGLPDFAIQRNPNGTVSPLEKAPITVDKEVLTITLSGKAPALIKANYNLRNLSNKRIATIVIFPVARNQKANVLFKGSLLKTKMTPFDTSLHPGDFEISKTWIDPYNNHRYIPNSPPTSSNLSYSPLRLDFISFQVEFEPNEESILQVSYEQPPSYDATLLFKEINYRFDYLLQPAKHWVNFDNLEINVFTNEKISMASSIALLQVGENHFQAKFNKLPKDNLSLFVGTEPSNFKESLGLSLLKRFYDIKVFAFLMFISVYFSPVGNHSGV